MHKRMSLSVFASLLAIPLTVLPAGAAPDECVGSPDRQPPEGSHWYYHLDRQTNRKCWYLGSQGAKARHVAAPKPDRVVKPAAADTPVDLPVADTTAAAVETTQDQAPRWLDPSRLAEASPVAPAWMSNPAPDEQPVASPGMQQSREQTPVSVSKAASAAPPVVSSKLMLALLGGALTLAAVIGRAIFRHAEAPRLFRRDVLDHVAHRWDAPIADDRTVPAFRRQDRSLGDDIRCDLAAAGHRGDDIEDMLRRLHHDWERVAA